MSEPHIQQEVSVGGVTFVNLDNDDKDGFFDNGGNPKSALENDGSRTTWTYGELNGTFYFSWPTVALDEPGVATDRQAAGALLSDWPIACPHNWVTHVNDVEDTEELAALHRGAPFGVERWAVRVAGRLGLESTLRTRGRPKKTPEK